MLFALLQCLLVLGFVLPELLLVQAHSEGFWQVLHHLKQNSEREGKKLEECTAKMKDQKILLEKELADQHKKLEQATAKVKLAEENLGRLEKEESQCAALEEIIRKSSKSHCTHELPPSLGAEHNGTTNIFVHLAWVLGVWKICAVYEMSQDKLLLIRIFFLNVHYRTSALRKRITITTKRQTNTVSSERDGALQV